MNKVASKPLSELLADDVWAESTFKDAVKEAILDHKRSGHPIAVWEDGAVKIIPPEEIEWVED